MSQNSKVLRHRHDKLAYFNINFENNRGGGEQAPRQPSLLFSDAGPNRVKTTPIFVVVVLEVIVIAVLSSRSVKNSL